MNAETALPMEHVKVSLFPEAAMDVSFPTPAASKVVETDAQGQFSIEYVTPGRYRVVPNRDGYVAVTTPLGGNIQGVVRDQDATKLSDAVVAIVPDPPLRAAGPLYRVSQSDVNGKFTLRGISPGSYRLFAWSELDGAAYRNAEFMKDFEDRGTPVRIERGQRLSLDITALTGQEKE